MRSELSSEYEEHSEAWQQSDRAENMHGVIEALESIESQLDTVTTPEIEDVYTEEVRNTVYGLFHEEPDFSDL